jgi:hypothetical protein
LGKYGSFPTKELIGKYYDIAYEVVSPKTSATMDAAEAAMLLDEDTPAAEGDANTTDKDPRKGKKAGKKEKGKTPAASGSAEGAGNILVPQRPAKIEELGEYLLKRFVLR